MRRALAAAALAAAIIGLGRPAPQHWQGAGSLERLGAVIRVPNATATPPAVILTGQVWLQATNLPEDDTVTVTLNAPDGTDCDLPSWQVQRQGREAKAVAVPSDCSDSEGAWTATFSVQRVTVKARFTAVAAPWFAANGRATAGAVLVRRARRLFDPETPSGASWYSMASGQPSAQPDRDTVARKDD